jgi:hypothetical protein
LSVPTIQSTHTGKPYAANSSGMDFEEAEGYGQLDNKGYNFHLRFILQARIGRVAPSHRLPRSFQ